MADVQQANRPVFKMENDFWQQQQPQQTQQQQQQVRQPANPVGVVNNPPQRMAQNLSNTSQQNSPVPMAHSPAGQQNTPQQQQQGGNNHVLALQQQHLNQQQAHAQSSQPNTPNNGMQPITQQQQAQQQQQQANANTPQLGSPNPHQQQQATLAAVHAQQQLAQHMQQQLPSSGQNSPEKMMTEKIVNELQLADFNQLQRNSSAISERTLEECWTTLQRVSWLLFDRIFMQKSAMHMHARDISGRSEVKPHQCQQCLKSFSSNHQLVQHIRVHTGEKPYKCSYCDRRFKQLSHVQQHTRLHTGERPYKCHLPDCGRAFIQLSNLQQHLRNHDAQVERAKNRPFHCNICGKGFATESSLRTHTSKVSHQCIGRLQQHAALIGGPNATSCPLCHKMFLGGEALMEHMKHTHKDPNASGVATKRRTANHPCPVCGKHYVNEGSLRKHLACHPETSQLSSSLRMWPCSVCQAVFTHEAGLLSHMEHMRMDPKHQFAAQYVLSRAAAERRDRELLAAAGLASAASSSGLLGLGMGGAASSSPMCASPSAHSDSSSGNGRLSSAGSEAGGINNNNNNCNTKIGDILRSNNGLHQQYNNMEEQLQNANRMSLFANMVNPTGVPPGLGSDTSTAAANIAAVNIANLAMRITQANQQVNNSSNPSTPPIPNDALSVMRASMDSIRNMDAMRSSVMDMSSPQQQQQQQQDALRMQQHAEALLRSQAETALRLAMSQVNRY
ncbi:zinc finger protein 135-like isoform X8 [Atheta coriaria]|uniref:zinc finger protein 135-like isoform X8 n=1 Tax=Dalotia coriaria TaxID=877792 RepID=UPI0031F462AD